MLWLAIHLPALPLQVFTRGMQSPSPIAIVAPPPRATILAATPAAEAAGVHCGQRSAGLREPGLQGLARADKVCAVQAAQRARCRAGVRDECKADVGAANVRDQARPGGGGGGGSRGSFGHGVFRHGEERRRSRRRNQTARLAA